MRKRYLILDCFVDEPACFGVPPFISPYPRCIYGSLLTAGVPETDIAYLAISSLRETDYAFTSKYDTVFLFGGAVVPGKYLGTKIGTAAEIRKIISVNPNSEFHIGGPVAAAMPDLPANARRVKGDIEKAAFSLISGGDEAPYRSTAETDIWCAAGAQIVKQHPDFPDVICEIETYRGCPREQHCSFCSEGLFPEINFRPIEGILREIDVLIAAGVTRFRIGRQADIIQYGSSLKGYVNGFPEPDPAPVMELFGELKSRRERGLIDVLNIDNANPGTIVNFPERSEKIISSIAAAVSEGDTMALGIESFDSRLIPLNNLKVTPAQAVEAVRIINRAGGERRNGIPAILPGINLIHGLRGETTETFKINFEILNEILNQGLMVKRINIRKLTPYPDTGMFISPYRVTSKTVSRFEFYRGKIRSEIDTEMLKRIYPLGTVIKSNKILENRNEYSLGKQIASYSITVKHPVNLPEGSFVDSVVVGHRERSLTCLPVPFRFNDLSAKALEHIPGISRKGASEILMNRPFSSMQELESFLTKKNIAPSREILNRAKF